MKKGFTLIELLAVIVILAVIAVIATPLIINVIDTARKGSFKSSVDGIVSSAEQGYTLGMLTNTEQDKVVYSYENGIETSTVEGKNLQYKGKKPQNGKVVVEGDGTVLLAVYDGKYCGYNDYNENTYVKEMTKEECDTMVIEPTAISCFSFSDIDDNSVMITGYDTTCSKDVAIPGKINGKFVTTINSASFSNITSVDIPSTVQVLKTYAFGNSGVVSVKLHEGLKTIENVAFVQSNITDLVIPNSVVSIAENAFLNNKIVNLTLGTGLKSIGGSAFYNNSIVNLDIPGNVETIGTVAFYNNNIAQLTLNNGIKTIGVSAFNDNKLTQVLIPNSVESIGSDAFTLNYITQGNGKIDNSEANVSIPSYIFLANGVNQDEFITPTFLR